MSEPEISPEFQAYLEQTDERWKHVARLIIPLPQRTILAIMTFLGVIIGYSMRTSLSVTIIAIVTPKIGHSLNSTIMECPFPSDYAPGLKDDDPQYDWNEQLVGTILSSFYIGYVITHIPGGILSDLLGGKHVLNGCVILSSLLTLITPLCITEGGPHYLILVRVLLGLVQGTMFPAVNVLLASWIPHDERAFYGSLVYGASHLGTVVGSSLSGFLLAKYHAWSRGFLIFGICGIVWAILFNLMCYQDPESHPYISDKEKNLLFEKIGIIHRTSRIKDAPWLEMLMNVPLAVLVIGQIGHDFGFFCMVTDLPKYLSDVLHYDISKDGYLSALPFIVMFVVALGTGYLADFITDRELISYVNCRKLFGTIGALLPSIFLLLASYSGCERATVVAFFTLSMGCMGFFYSGMRVNSLDLSPRFAGTVVAYVDGVGTIMGIAAPLIVGSVSPHSTVDEYRIVFWIAFILFNGTMIPYIFFASADVQPFNFHGHHLKPIPDVPKL